MILRSTGLPVEKILPRLNQALQQSNCVLLCAEPGAGKSTLVPPSLLDADFLHGQKILMLEPRRIAASGAAKRIAWLLGEETGKTAGYRTRFGSRISKETRIEVITEGILTRMIQDDPELKGVGMIIFDEYHERSLQADLGLALALDVQNALREDLRILIMSATMDTERINRLFDHKAPLITSEGKVYPVKTLYFPPENESIPIEKSAGAAVVYALNNHPGDILVFLPGESEIRRTLTELASIFPDASAQKLEFLPLYGNLPEADQDRALAPAEPGFRKVICATPVAESSVTVPGVQIVIDSGWMRVSRFSPATAMNKLETVRVSSASADQRRGRAARTGPGLCIRLWSMVQERSFPAFNTPEILESDLAPLALELAKWGITPDTISNLHWLDPPPAGKLNQAFELLQNLNAVEPGSARLTAHGEQLLKLPMHPRLAHLIFCAEKLHHPALGCALAVLLAERDFLRETASSDIRERLAILAEEKSSSGNRIDRGTLQRIRTAYRQLTAKPFPMQDLSMTGVLTAIAYPDRIARVKTPNSGEYTLANGTAAKLRDGDDMCKFEFLCLPVVEGAARIPTVFLSAELTLADIEKYFAAMIRQEVTVQWSDSEKNLSIWREKRLGSIVLQRKSLPANSPELPEEQRIRCFLNGIRKSPLPWSEHEISKMQRIAFLHKVLGDKWPDLNPETLASTMENWLVPFLTPRHTSLESLRGQTLADAFQLLIGQDKLRQLDSLAPEKLKVPSGSCIRIDYSRDQPLLPVRLQEIFGMTHTPKLAGGRIPLVMNLLSPAMRTVQITADLEHFWSESYFLVRKEMRGKYPKHDWPENPLEVPAHRGVRRKEQS